MVKIKEINGSTDHEVAEAINRWIKKQESKDQAFIIDFIQIRPIVADGELWFYAFITYRT